MNIYSCYANGKCLGTGPAGYWSETLGVKSQHVNKYAALGYKFNGTYSFELIEGKTSQVGRNEDRSIKMREDFAQEWDETVARIRRACLKK